MTTADRQRFPTSNRSGTARDAVGGYALKDGVVMLSRTGYSAAFRLRDGRIRVVQVPYRRLGGVPGDAARSWAERAFRLPLIAGAATMLESMVLMGSLRADVPTGALPQSAARALGERLQAVAATLGACGVVVALAASGAAAAVAALGPERATAHDYPAVFALATAGVVAFLVAGGLAALGFSADWRQCWRYHAAEHRAVAAYEARPDLTVAQCRTFPILHRRCGMTQMALGIVALSGLVLGWEWFALSTISGYANLGAITTGLVFAVIGPALWLGAMGIAALVQGLVRDTAPGRWVLQTLFAPLQALTVRTPDDRELEVAIIALLGAVDIVPGESRVREWIVSGLEEDESAPGYRPDASPARIAPTEVAPA